MALHEQLESQGKTLFKYRGHLPVLFLLAGLAAFAYYDLNHNEAGDFWNDSYAFFCLAVCFVGFIIRVITVGHTPTNTSGKNTEEHMADELNTTGMYSITRNPLYLGNFFMWLGVALLTQSLWFVVAFIFFYWIYYERIIYSEEEFLRNSYGERYLSWANATPVFIPAFKKWAKPSWTFSWKKVLKK